jgi:glycosyltransferase involved in cell wall biosynthesis
LNADYTFATGWPTVDVVKTITNTRHKLYFVQDYEPNFYEKGSIEYHLAEESYQKGLIPLSIGPYLTKKIKTKFGIKKGYYFEFASDRNVYFKQSEKYPKMRIIFYARPSTKRRGFQIGIDALTNVYLKHRDEVEIALYGADNLADHNIPFPYTDLGILPQDTLAEEFARSHIGVCFSLSNMSLVPLDMMSCKCAVVEIASERVLGTLQDGHNCLLATYDAKNIAEKINALITDTKMRARITDTAFEFVSKRSWEKSAQQIQTVLQKLK